MGTRLPSHQLSNGLYVSGLPDHQLKDRLPTMAARAIPYTGGDIKNSGELEKMFDISTIDHQNPPPLKLPRSSASSSSQPNSGFVRSGSYSNQHSGSGPIPRKSSGPMTPLQPTGLITSVTLGSLAALRCDQLEPGHPEGSGRKAVYSSAVTSLNGDMKLGFKVLKPVMWVFLVVALMVLVVGAFLMLAEKKAVVALAVGGVLLPVLVVVLWNCARKERGLLGFFNRYPNAELRGAVDGQYVKVTGVVTCGSIPLESSFQRVPRCVYVSTELYEYKGWGGKSAKPKHRLFSWGCRHAEKYVADFYVSDFQSGFRAQVKAGYGAKVSAFVKPTTVADITKENREVSPNFLRWLTDHSLSSDDRVMRLKEGYIKEGSTVTVMGVVRRRDNVLMIVPPAEPVSTGCQWAHCLLPAYIEGLVLTCDESQNADVVPM